jgi:transcriptional regulator MraZ
MDQAAPGATLPKPPLEMCPSRLDDKGRLKLPADFHRYLSGLADKRLFVTSLDRRIASIYPISVWEQNERFFEDYTEDPTRAENVAFTAADLGGEAEVDPQGRLQFPAKLRRELELENQTVHLYAYKSAIRVISDAIYQARLSAAKQSPEADVKELQKKGLK